jgi:hypothetical protein
VYLLWFIKGSVGINLVLSVNRTILPHFIHRLAPAMEFRFLCDRMAPFALHELSQKLLHTFEARMVRW